MRMGSWYGDGIRVGIGMVLVWSWYPPEKKCRTHVATSVLIALKCILLLLPMQLSTLYWATLCRVFTTSFRSDSRTPDSEIWI